MNHFKMIFAELDKPKFFEYFLAFFVSFSILANFISLFNGEFFWSSNQNYIDPYSDYNNNFGIKTISNLVFILDSAIFLMVVYWRFEKGKEFPLKVIVVASLLCIILCWFELWYGSTFYYGEVRDKQGLPFGINNGGLSGSYLFSFYLVLRLAIAKRSNRIKRILFAVSAAIVIYILHYSIYSMVCKPWDMLQS